MADTSALEAFKWETQPKAEQLVRRLIRDFLANCAPAASLAERMREQTGTRFHDWVDDIAIRNSDALAGELERAGFVVDAYGAHAHPGGIFPRIILHDDATTRLALKVESVADFLSANQIQAEVEGDALCVIRRARVGEGHETELYVCERHGFRGFDVPKANAELGLKRLHHVEEFRRRPRNMASNAEGFAAANKLIDAAIKDLGRDLTSDIFFAAEREYWQRRNRAAQVQKSRQDRLGLGWANHDHHTYRCSREDFMQLIAMWEKLGFICRERFHAGLEAGWGAQVMDQASTGITTFNDVDLSPEELFQDFAHEPLAVRDSLGTVGLWCGLHGEAFLQAGMHHLECQFDFEALRAQLETDGVRTMKPFTDYPYLKQAFTEGERWPVAEDCIQRLLSRKLITESQAKTFREQGAIGSHLENLERNEGFKGFNQKGVSEIISATDPRKQAKHVAVGA